MLLFALAGCLFGIITGLTPGVHVNTLGLIFLGFAYTIDPHYIAVMIISMAISHTFFDFIPSIFLGAPEPETALSVLPGHKLLLEGKGFEAMYLTVIGGLGAIIATLLFFPFLLLAIPTFYSLSRPYIHIILALIAGVMILSEPGVRRKAFGFFVFMLSGLLGIILLNSYVISSQLILFPIFTGLFGLSSLLISLNRQSEIPKQQLSTPKIEKGVVISGILKGLFSGSLVGTLPSIGAAQATILTQEITRKKDDREFLISIGAINTIVALFSIVALYTIAKPRSGAAVFVSRTLTEFGFNELLLLLAVTLISTGVSVILVLKLMKGAVKHMQRVNYKKLTTAVIVFLLGLTIFLTGLYGLLVLCVSTAVGVLAPLFGVKRSNLMGVLMVPVILFFAGL